MFQCTEDMKQTFWGILESFTWWFPTKISIFERFWTENLNSIFRGDFLRVFWRGILEKISVFESRDIELQNAQKIMEIDLGSSENGACEPIFFLVTKKYWNDALSEPAL